MPKWVESVNPDIVCLQEIKAMPDQFDNTLFNNLGFECYIHSATKKGYSGVAIMSKIKPKHIEYGCGIEEIDFEGRIIRADYDSFSVMSVYFPSGSSGDIRQDFKFKFLDLFENYIANLKRISQISLFVEIIIFVISQSIFTTLCEIRTLLVFYLRKEIG